MENRKITKLFKLAVQLLELHDAPVPKLRPYQNVVAALENTDAPLAGKTAEELQQLNGIGKSMSAKIVEVVVRGSFAELDELLANTPEGLLEVLKLKGIGPKKVRALWQELEIDDLHKLMEACEAGKVAQLKGFGAKTQENIKEAIAFLLAQEGKFLFAEVEETANELVEEISKLKGAEQVSLVGDIRRYSDIISSIGMLVSTKNTVALHQSLSEIELLSPNLPASGPFAWRGNSSKTGSLVEVHFCAPEEFGEKQLQLTGSLAHLNEPVAGGQTLLQISRAEKGKSEEEIYASAGLAYVLPEMREGLGEVDLAAQNKLPKLVELSDLKGILHNHSTYSDGAHTLEQMAIACRDLGYEYFGIADHSKAAFYASGMQEFTVKKQQEEIDQLNQKLAPFRIFKGIESDILLDGSLDYSDEILDTFDYVVASVHSPLNMDIVKATDRLITAIRNPYTTILGHPTGRLLLRREGYPIDHKAVIDACAEFGVVIEINANPWRLDIDWRWIPYCLEKGVMLSINPDAHSTGGLLDMRYGVLSGRKGGLTKEMTLNALGREALEEFFKARKKH